MQKTNVPGIYKVCDGILINKDDEGLKAYKTKKNKDRKLFEMESKIDKFEKELSEIKELLIKALNK